MNSLSSDLVGSSKLSLIRPTGLTAVVTDLVGPDIVGEPRGRVRVATAVRTLRGRDLGDGWPCSAVVQESLLDRRLDAARHHTPDGTVTRVGGQNGLHRTALPG